MQMECLSGFSQGCAVLHTFITIFIKNTLTTMTKAHSSTQCLTGHLGLFSIPRVTFYRYGVGFGCKTCKSSAEKILVSILRSQSKKKIKLLSLLDKLNMLFKYSSKITAS